MHRKAHQKQPSPPYPSAVLCSAQPTYYLSEVRGACSAPSRTPAPARETRALLPAASRPPPPPPASSLPPPPAPLPPPPPPLSAAPHPRVAGSARGTSPAGAAEQGGRRDLTGGSREAGAPSQAEPPRRTCGSGRLRAGAAVYARLGVRLPP